jgi:hypothetical protein
MQTPDKEIDGVGISLHYGRARNVENGLIQARGTVWQRHGIQHVIAEIVAAF